MNSEPRSEVMWDGMPCFENTWVRNSWASSRESMESWVGMKRDCFVRWSTITNIAVCPSDAGSCSIKSIEMDSHGRGGIGSCLRKPYGFLKQLPIPPLPWESISMDFIEHLPASEGHTAILVIVDHLTKQSLFIPTHDSINSLELAQLFLTHVFSKHGMPSHVTSDWGSEFISHFFQSLSKLLWMELHFMSGYHLEGDGQMEHLNQVLEQYL